MSDGGPSLLILAPAGVEIPPLAPLFTGWALNVRDACGITQDRSLEGSWDVVAFHADSLRASPPEQNLDTLRRLAPEATFLAFSSAPDVTEAMRYLKGGVFEYTPLPLDAQAFANSVTGALENRDAYREILQMTELLMGEKTALERKNRELEAISLVAQAVGRSLDIDEVLRNLVDSIRDAFPFDRVTVGLVDRGRMVEETKIAAGHTEGETAGISWALGRADAAPWMRAVFQEGRTLHVDDPDTDPLVAGTLLAKAHDGPLAKVPLLARGAVLGSVTVDNHKSREPITAEELRILQIFADTAAASVENARLYAMMRDLSERDELTGLFNRRHLHERAEAEIGNASRHELPLSLLLLDLDHFKELNDRNDHLVGDAALQQVARILQNSTRGIDTVARYGGEEMVVLLPRTTPVNALRVAEKLRKAVEMAPIRGETALPGGRLTVSVGLSSYPENGETFRDLVEAADKALYRAKRAGRNRVEAAPPRENA